METPDDVVAKLGYLALGTRLKRAAEQLQSGVAEVLAGQSEAVAPAQLPVLVAIAEGKALTVAQLVQAIGVSQPAVSRMLRTLEAKGLVTTAADSVDARVRRLTVTAKAEALLETLRTSLFPKVAAAAEELCSGIDLLDQLAVVESRNREMPFAERIRRARS
jgi:DNA-binding MarR family transcriptional regulator